MELWNADPQRNLGQCDGVVFHEDGVVRSRKGGELLRGKGKVAVPVREEVIQLRAFDGPRTDGQVFIPVDDQPVALPAQEQAMLREILLSMMMHSAPL